MRILYLLTSPPPAIPGTDAVFQDVAALQARFGGHVLNLFPLHRPTVWYPKWFYGLHLLSRVRGLRATHDLCHVFYPFLYPFPFLRQLGLPVVYSVVAGLESRIRAPVLPDHAVIRRIIVSNERDDAILKSWGVSCHRLIQPGIDISRFRPTPFPSPQPFTLLVGSAPWTLAQFRTKGIDALLETVSRMPDLKLLFLWRGLLLDPLVQRIARQGVGDRCEIVNERVDVAAVLARCHATVVLAESAKLVKAWPHSLLETLICGRPVLVSRTVPMADYVAAHRCGVVSEEISAIAVSEAVRRLRNNFTALSRNAIPSSRDFSLERFQDAHGKVYEEVGDAENEFR